MRQYMKNKPIKWAFKFLFHCGAKSGYLYEFDMYLGKKGNTEFGLGESVILSLCQKLKDMHGFVFFDNFFTSLLAKLLEMGIYATGTVRVNRKNIPVLVILSQLYFYPITSTQRRCNKLNRVKGSKDKVRVT